MEEKTRVEHRNELSIQDFKDQLPDSEKTVFNHQLTDTKKEVEKFKPDQDQNAVIDKVQERIKNRLQGKSIDPNILRNMAIYEALQEYVALPSRRKSKFSASAVCK